MEDIPQEGLDGASSGLHETIAALQQEAFAQARASRSGDVSLKELVVGFVHAVDFQEPWIIALLSFHVSLLLFVVFGRRWLKTQAAVFVLLCAAVRASEYINVWLGKRWRSFASQNYFDPRGVFMVVMFAGPIVLILTLQLIVFMYTASNLLVKVKAEEFKRDAKRKAKEQGADKPKAD